MSRMIKLLGNLVVEENGRFSRINNSAKGSALLAYLIVTDETQPRDGVADLLWEATSTEQARRNLRELLARVRKWVPDLQATRKTITFHATPDTFVDLFALRDGLHADDLSQIDAALQLYRGDLLAAFHLEGIPRFNEWLTLERERLRRQVLEAYRHLCEAYAERQQWSKAATAVRRWLALDDLNEEATRWLMQLLANNGNIAGAMETYEQCRLRLDEELGVEPDPATTELLQQIRQMKTAVFPIAPALILPDADILPEPGALPPHAYLPYHRNNDFTGRETALLHLAELLLVSDAEQPITRAAAVMGMGGLGKTQLAVEFCYRYGRFFSGGVYWIRFAQAGNIAEEVALIGNQRGMGLYRDADNLTLADRVGLVQRAWQEPTPRLLIFDNCEEEQLLRDWLPVTGGCRVLLTSRRGHWSRESGVTACPLNALGEADAITLLQRQVPTMNAQEAADIGWEVGYLPLAIHLAGGFLRRYQHITPAHYLVQLRDAGLVQHPSLLGRGSDQSPTGHELNIVRTYAINIQQLDLADKIDEMAWKLLIRAACFAPSEPIPKPLLLKTIAIEDGDFMAALLVEDGLTRLVALGFLEAEGNKSIVMHRLLAAFTHETAVNPPVQHEKMERAQSAVESTILHLLSAYQQKQGHLSLLPFSVAHLRHVVETAVSRTAVLAADLTIFLSRHLISIGTPLEAERYLKQAAMVAKETGDNHIQAKTLVALSVMHENMGYDHEALQNAQEAVVLLKALQPSNATKLAEALYRQGWAHFRLGHAKDALSAAQEGVELSQRENIVIETARHFNLMGVVNYYLLGQYDIAAEQLQESLRIYKSLAHRNSESAILNNMGENARLQGDYLVAAAYYEEAITIAREVENRTQENLYTSNLCGVWIRVGKSAEAVTALEKLIAHTQSDWYGLSEAHRFLAEAYLNVGKTAVALTMAQRALTLAHLNNDLENGRAWRVLGLAAARSGQPVPADPENAAKYDAAACFGKSIACFDASALERDRAITLWRWAQHEFLLGNGERGSALHQDARETFARLNLPLFIARIDESEPHPESF